MKNNKSRANFKNKKYNKKPYRRYKANHTNSKSFASSYEQRRCVIECNGTFTMDQYNYLSIRNILDESLEYSQLTKEYLVNKLTSVVVTVTPNGIEGEEVYCNVLWTGYTAATMPTYDIFGDDTAKKMYCGKDNYKSFRFKTPKVMDMLYNPLNSYLPTVSNNAYGRSYIVFLKTKNQPEIPTTVTFNVKLFFNFRLPTCHKVVTLTQGQLSTFGTLKEKRYVTIPESRFGEAVGNPKQVKFIERLNKKSLCDNEIAENININEEMEKEDDHKITWQEQIEINKRTVPIVEKKKTRLDYVREENEKAKAKMNKEKLIDMEDEKELALERQRNNLLRQGKIEKFYKYYHPLADDNEVMSYVETVMFDKSYPNDYFNIPETKEIEEDQKSESSESSVSSETKKKKKKKKKNKDIPVDGQKIISGLKSLFNSS